MHENQCSCEGNESDSRDVSDDRQDHVRRDPLRPRMTDQNQLGSDMRSCVERCGSSTDADSASEWRPDERTSSENESQTPEHSTGEVLTPFTKEDLTKSLLDIVTESWRLARLFGRVLDQLDIQEQPRYRSQCSWFKKKLQDSLGQVDLEIVSVEGHPHDSGLPVTALNLQEFNADETLAVDQMIEPIIKGPTGTVVRTGTVTVKRVQS